jgi:hypothetical protein
MANKTWAVNHRGKDYTFSLSKLRVSYDHCAELARVLKEAVTDAGYAAKQVDRELVNHVLGLIGSGAEISNEAITELGEIYESKFVNGQEGNEMATKPASGTSAPMAPGLEAVRGMNRIGADPEGKIALQRWRNGQDLTPQQQMLVDDYRAFEKAHADLADAEKRSYDPPKPLNRYIGKDVMAFAVNQNKVQRQQLAAEHRAKVLGDMNHPYWNASSTEHKAAVVGMKIATQMMQTGDSDVQIGPDGTIEE